MKVVCIHQPDFVPYLGFFHRLVFTDVFVVLDDVQFLRRGWHHRDKILTRNGPKWLTIRVNKGPITRMIKDVVIVKGDWKEKQLKLIETSYQNTPGFQLYYPSIENIYNRDTTNLMEFNLGFIRWGCEVLGIKIKERLASSYKVRCKGTERLVEIVKKEKATHYLTGLGSRDYLEEECFGKSNIKVIWQNFEHPYYKQKENTFYENLSFLDFLMFSGKEARKIFDAIAKIKI